MAVSIDEIIVRLAHTNDGVVTWAQLQRAGLTPPSVRRRIGGLLTRFSRGVYFVGEPTKRSLLRAVLEATPSGAAADQTAAGLLRLPVARSSTIFLVAPHGITRSFDDRFQLRQTRWLPVADLTTARGLPCTSLERTICDLAPVVHERVVRHLVEWAITERRMTRRSFQACARGFCRRGRPGSGLIRSLDVALLDDEPFPSSELERLGQALFRRSGLAGFVKQYEPPWFDGINGIVDFAWPDLQVIVELDGRRWHSVTRAQVADRRRDRTANANGWFVLRFGWQELTERPHDLVVELRAFLDERRRALAA